MSDLHLDTLKDIISPKFTEKVLYEIVKKKTKWDEIQLKKIDINSDASKKGDSYLSTVCRFTIFATGSTHSSTQNTIQLHVITKCLPQNLGRRKTFRSVDFFENEIIFYETVWKAFEEFQDLKNIQDKFNNIPVFLAAHIDGSNDFIALEDLSYDGFQSVDRSKGLDLQKTKAILKVFAEFHAIALAFKDQNPTEFKKVAHSLKETYFAEKFKPWYETFQIKLIGIIRDTLEKELSDDYVKTFDRFIGTDLFERISKLCIVDEPLSAVTHGDSWIPNFLMKCDNENQWIVKMIDFQLTRYTYLGNDLTFFLLTCVDLNVLEKHWNDLLVEYWRYLSNYIEKLGSDRNLVTLEALKDNIHNSITFGLAMAMEALCISMLDDDEVFDIDGIKDDNGVPLEMIWDLQPFKDKNKIKRIASTIKFVFDNDFFSNKK